MKELDDNYKLNYDLTVYDFLKYKNIIDDIDSKIKRGIKIFDEEEIKIFEIIEEYKEKIKKNDYKKRNEKAIEYCKESSLILKSHFFSDILKILSGDE